MRHFFTNKKISAGETDADILAQYQVTGNPACIGVLFERYGPIVYAVCLKYLRDEEESRDAVSKIFEKLFSDLKKYKIGAFKQWIHQVAKNHCFTLLEKRKQNTTVSLEENKYDQYQLDDNEQGSLNYSTEQLTIAISELENHQRVCIIFFYLQKKPYSKISIETGYTIKEVKSYIQNGKRNLKVNLIRSHGKL